MSHILSRFKTESGLDPDKLKRVSVLYQRAIVAVPYPLETNKERCLLFESIQNFSQGSAMTQYLEREFVDDFKFKLTQHCIDERAKSFNMKAACFSLPRIV